MKKLQLGKSISTVLILVFLAGTTPGLAANAAQNRKNNYIPYAKVQKSDEGMYWPDGQVLPTFATPADPVDTISIGAFDHSNQNERLTITALQGIVNRTKPRILFTDMNPDEGPDTWRETPNLHLNCNVLANSQKFEFIQKYIGETRGIVIFPASKDANQMHMMNLATTVAGIHDMLPMDENTYDLWKSHGISLPDIDNPENEDRLIDLRNLALHDPLEIYTYLYDNYWELCNHRLLISLSPDKRHYVRDYAAAAKSAVVWLDNRDEDQRQLFEKFLTDMEAGNGLVLGWAPTERSGVTICAKHGLSLVPADHYINGTVFGGTDPVIQIPKVPDKPELDDKVYIAPIMTDGDNIQYIQRYMRKLWDSPGTVNSRGKVPISWTISPALVDAGPGLLNYYYSQATDCENFVCGPSGMGYAMFENTLPEPGVPARNYLENDELLADYARLTNRYMYQSGLRAVTVWDTLSGNQRDIYTENARYLYGLTVHDFRNLGTVPTSLNNNKPVYSLDQAYYSAGENSFYNLLKDYIKSWDGSAPYFLALGMNVWGDTKPNNIVNAAERLKEEYGDQVEFVRLDHFMALYSEKNRLPFNLGLSSGLTVTATSHSDKAELTVDGTPAGRIWTAPEAGVQSLTYSLGETYVLSRYLIQHAGSNGLDSSLNTRDYTIEISMDGKKWTLADQYQGNTYNVSDIDIDPVEARYVRLNITDPGADGIARIAEVELYGAVAKSETGISITNRDASIIQGQSLPFEITRGSRSSEGGPEIWSVVGGGKGTTITEDGVLTIDKEETAKAVKVVATVKVPGFGEVSDDVTVVVLPRVRGVRIHGPSLVTLKAGSSAELDVDITPSDAADPSVSWASSNPIVAVVDENGVVTGISPGMVVITVETSDGGYQHSIVMKVN